MSQQRTTLPEVLAHLYRMNVLCQFGRMPNAVTLESGEHAARVYHVLLLAMLRGDRKITFKENGAVAGNAVFQTDKKDSMTAFAIATCDATILNFLTKASSDSHPTKTVALDWSEEIDDRVAGQLKAAGDKIKRSLAETTPMNEEIERNIYADVLRKLGCDIPV